MVGKKRVFPGICLRFTRVAILVDGHPMRDFWVFFRVPPARTNTDILLAADSPGLPQEIPTFSHFSRDSPGVPRGFPRKPQQFSLFFPGFSRDSPGLPQETPTFSHFSRDSPGVPRGFPRKPPHFHIFPRIPQGFPRDSPENPNIFTFFQGFPRGSPGIPQEIYYIINQIQKTVQNGAFFTYILNMGTLPIHLDLNIYCVGLCLGFNEESFVLQREGYIADISEILKCHH